MSKAPDNNHNQLDFFIASLVDLSLRDQRETMEVPFFSLAKSPRFEPIIYQTRDCYVKVSPSVSYGMATIWDADILIWAASQINAAQERGLTPSRTLQLHPYDLLKTINRHTGKRSYDLLRDALRRLQSTSIETDIRAKGKKRLAQFSWIESWSEIIDEKTGRSDGMKITLSEWFYEGVLDQQLLLSIPSAYFDITGGTERWLYRLVRKHAGRQATGWSCTFHTLHKKSGSTQRPSDFSRDIRKIITADNLPEYHLEMHQGERNEPVMYAVRRDKLPVGHAAAEFIPTLSRHLPSSVKSD